MNKLFEHIKGDKVIWVVVTILSIISVLVVYSSSGVLVFKNGSDLNTEQFLIKHLAIIIVGFFLMYQIHLIPYTEFARFAKFLFFLSLPLLFYTMNWGMEINEAKRWIRVPYTGLSFQTSDFAKLALILYISVKLAEKDLDLSTFKSIFKSLFIPIFLSVGLIFPEDSSTAGILFLIAMMMIYYGGVSFKILSKFGTYMLIGVVVGVFVIRLAFPDFARISTMGSRITELFNEVEEGSHSEQALIAIANGGLFGKMPGHSTQKYILPHPYSDSAFAFTIDEYGLIGGVFVVFLYLVLLYRGVRISMRAPGLFGSLVSIGITLMFVSQAFIHMLVWVRLFPLTGQQLPFISMGGTSIMLAFISAGILLSVSKEDSSNKEGGKHG
jgi:cell division protein FtsW